MSFSTGYNGNTRGVMSRIPIDETRRKKSIKAIELLLSSGSLDRATLFSSVPSDQKARRWQKPLLERMLKDGAIKAVGTTRDRKYMLRDASAVQKIKLLLNEEDASLRQWGYGNTFNMTSKLRSLLDGILLGDGHYTQHRNKLLSSSMTLGQREDRFQWIESVKEILDDSGIVCTVQDCPPVRRLLKSGKILTGRASYVLRTGIYRTLLQERQRWYPDGKKIIPRDIDVSNPVTLAQWFMGDGSVYHKQVTLSTHCFSEEDVKWLSEQFLKTLGITASVGHWRHYPILLINFRDAFNFIELIRPHVLSCFDYKIKALTWKIPVCGKCGEKIIGMTMAAKKCDSCCSTMSYRRMKLETANAK